MIASQTYVLQHVFLESRGHLKKVTHARKFKSEKNGLKWPEMHFKTTFFGICPFYVLGSFRWCPILCLFTVC